MITDYEKGDKIVVKEPHTEDVVWCVVTHHGHSAIPNTPTRTVTRTRPSTQTHSHQDWAFYPHTNDDLCTVSVVMEDMSLERGGLCFVPGSHRGPVYSHHDSNGQFVGGIADSRFDPDAESWESVECRAGSLIVHHARTVHASPSNDAAALRPLLLLQYAANDAWPLQQNTRGAWGVELPTGHNMEEW